jgi:hypothetical protein
MKITASFSLRRASKMPQRLHASHDAATRSSARVPPGTASSAPLRRECVSYRRNWPDFSHSHRLDHECMKFVATDVFGNTVVGSDSAWSHTQGRHPEMLGKEDAVKLAIEQPVSVHRGGTPAVSLFKGQTIAAGFWKGSFVIAVVEYTKKGSGHLMTAYLSTLDPRGEKIWP